MKEYIEVGAERGTMPFVPAVVASGRTVYLSGATAFPLIHSHPHVAEELRVPKDIGDQTHKTLENLQTALEAAGGQLSDIVKVTIYNTRMDEQDKVNDVYSRFFGDARPARSHIGVERLVGPELMIEIEAIAVID